MITCNRKSQRDNFRYRTFVFLSALILSSCTISESRQELNIILDGLDISNTLYVKEDSWGMGPGANETGVILYKLPDETAREILKTGLSYFTAIPTKINSSRDWRNVYGRWQETPILADRNWADPESDREKISASSPQKLSNYINRYGFGIPIDPLIEKEVNNAISKSVSYLTYGRGGSVLIVIPYKRKVVFAYSG